MIVESELTLHCPRKLRESWPEPLAKVWHNAYPFFDEDDLRITKTQPTKHFYEWFAAVHLFERYSAYSLIEKYRYEKAHPHKQKALRATLTPELIDALDEVCEECQVQVPDILAWVPGTQDYWFAEVKGGADPLSEKQLSCHERMEKLFDRPVQIISVKLSD
jgi:hypothetical protein